MGYDQLYEHEGVPVIAVHQNISESLKDKTLDLRETEKGPLFVLN